MQRRTLTQTKIVVQEITQTVVDQPGITPKIVSIHQMALRRD